jgi:AsmA protein
MKIVIGLAVVLVLIVGTILALPFLIDLSRFQDQYKPAIETALNRQVHIQEIRLTIWPRIGARVAGFTVLDDPAFGSGPFASLASLDVGVELLPLLSGKIEVEAVTLRDPVITVVKNKNGVLNVSTLGRPGVPAPETPSRAPLPSAEGPLKILGMLAVDRVALTGGTLTYRDLSADKPVEYMLQDLDVRLTSVRLGQTPTLHLDTVVQPFATPLVLDGTFGPLKETTDLDAVDLRLAFGKTAFAITGKTVGRNATADLRAAEINTADLPMALPLKKPVSVKDLHIAAEVRDQEVLLNGLSFQLFDGHVNAKGTVIGGSNAPPFDSTARIQGLQLGPALAAVAATPLSISGTAAADLALRGRGFTRTDLTKALEGTGHVAIKDGAIEGVNLLQEAVSMLKLAGIALDNTKATAFSTIETDVAVKQGVVTVQRLLMDSRDFQATGTGTISFDQQLNLTVNLHLSQDLSRKLAGASPVVKLAMKEDRVTLPLTVTGTLQVPSYGLDTKSLTGKVQEHVQKKVEEAVGGLLKGTTKPKDLEQQGKDLLKGLLGR